ncbi:MAG TPA: chemotaxis protein CheD [Maritimibacter sp.]|nr:chemotaxis protein CheD [Maritimibacter sp.]
MTVAQKRAGRTVISQGEFAIDGGDDAIIATLLGSCVSACLWDPVRCIGGMNHVLFSDNTSGSADAFGHGVNAMELLINGLQRLGANKSGLRAKLFGGAKMIGGLSDAGERNAHFVSQFLESEGIPQVGGDLGGFRARRLEFWPGTGRARLKFVDQDVPVAIGKVRADNDVELF